MKRTVMDGRKQKRNETVPSGSHAAVRRIVLFCFVFVFCLFFHFPAVRASESNRVAERFAATKRRRDAAGVSVVPRPCAAPVGPVRVSPASLRKPSFIRFPGIFAFLFFFVKK